jgi:hypothetical protein
MTRAKWTGGVTQALFCQLKTLNSSCKDKRIIVKPKQLCKKQPESSIGLSSVFGSGGTENLFNAYLPNTIQPVPHLSLKITQ